MTTKRNETGSARRSSAPAKAAKASAATTAKKVPAKPSAAKPSAAKPGAAKPSAAKPGAAKPSAAKPSTSRKVTSTEPSAQQPPAKPKATAPARARSPWVIPSILIAACVALLAVGVVLLVRAHHVDTTGPAANKAIIDRSATSEVSAQVSTALNQVFTYSYKNPAAARQAASRWLTGDAPAQYDKLLALLQKVSKGQNLTMTARVTKVGVSALQDGKAQLLVYLDQSSTRANDGASSVSAAQVQIVAVRKNGGWKISELKPL